MRTIKITRMEDVRAGDDVTLTRDGVTVSGTLESSGTSLRPDANWHMYFVGVGTLYGRDGWTLISATREVHEYEPDDAESLRRSLEVAREGHRKEAAGWRAQIRRMGAEVDRLDADLDNARAEVERWKAEAEMLTAKVDRLMPLQEHENECSYRQRSEKAEAEVERLRAELEGLRDAMDGSTHFLISSGGTIWHHDQNCPNRRTVPTREQVAMSMYAELKGAMDLSWGRLDPIDRGEWERAADTVLALIEQGGAR